MCKYAKIPKKIKHVEQNENELLNRNVQATNCEDIQHHCEQSNRVSTRRQASLSGLYARTAPFEPAHTCNRDAPSIGQDLWRKLKRVQIPVFHGDKRTYQS